MVVDHPILPAVFMVAMQTMHGWMVSKPAIWSFGYLGGCA